MRHNKIQNTIKDKGEKRKNVLSIRHIFSKMLAVFIYTYNKHAW